MVRILIIILFIVRFTGCEKSKDNSDHNFWIYYSRGSEWTGWSYEININSQGQLNVHERRNLPDFSEKNLIYYIDRKEIDTLLNGLKAISLIKLNNYGSGENKPYDLPGASFKYKLNNHSDSASIYKPENNEVPKQLYLIIDVINRIIVKYDKKK
ncbi:MAG: hypothetical protein NTV31_10485 [Bacteroidia bacterium]|nr:hypothetical protein [Bacteroidia bacterium]